MSETVIRDRRRRWFDCCGHYDCHQDGLCCLISVRVRLVREAYARWIQEDDK